MRYVIVIASAMLMDIAHAQPYPSRTVRIIVAFPPGGGEEIVARVMGQQLTDIRNQPVAGSSPDQFAASRKPGFDNSRRVIREANIKAE